MARTYRQEKLEGIIRSGKTKDTQCNGKNIKTRKASRGNEKRKPKDTQYNGKNIKKRKA